MKLLNPTIYVSTILKAEPGGETSLGANASEFPEPTSPYSRPAGGPKHARDSVIHAVAKCKAVQ